MERKRENDVERSRGYTEIERRNRKREGEMGEMKGEGERQIT